MKLIKPCLKFAKSWQAALAEFRAENAVGFWNYIQEPTSLDNYIKRTENESLGINLAPSK